MPAARRVLIWLCLHRTPEAKSLFQIHHPGFFAPGSPELRELLEAVADPQVLELVRDTCNTADPMFSHTSIFFNPEEFNPPPAAEHPGSSECCGEWHRDAQYIHPNEEDEKGLVLHPEEVMGGQMMCGATAHLYACVFADYRY